MTNLALSNVLKVDVSTYENWSMDTVYEQMGYDLEECRTIKDGKEMIAVQWLGDVEIDEVNCEDWLDFDNFKKELAKSIQDALEYEVEIVMKTTLKDVFKKYGMEYNGMNFYTPKAYNYENDSLDIRLECIDSDWSIEKYGLRELVEQYIENERQESYDWYMSFEPSKIEDVDWDNYAVLWAILHKEKSEDQSLWDILNECLQSYVDEWYSELVWANSNPVYEVKVPNGKKKMRRVWSYADNNFEVYDDWDRKPYKLDFDNKVLVPIN